MRKNVLVLLVMLALACTVHAQSTASLGIHTLSNKTYVGLSITGAVDTVYAIEYTTELEETNDWSMATLLRLPSSPHLWTDGTSLLGENRFYRAVEVGVEPTTNMVFIQPGTFTMGSPASEVDRYIDEGPQTTVTISRGFWMGIYEVTQDEYEDVIGTNPSSFTGDVSRPVDNVSWFDATNYCSMLTSRERSAGRIPSGYVYRLPTEAEWEYACRAGTSTRFSHGNDPGYGELGNYAWHWTNSGVTNIGVTPHPVGGKGANPWGLYDMHGNVYEWCQDWYGAYPGGVVSDPSGPASSSYRVLRGGSWGSFGRDCRSACRNWFDPTGVYGNLGFRVVLAPVQ